MADRRVVKGVKRFPPKKEDKELGFGKGLPVVGGLGMGSQLAFATKLKNPIIY